MTVALGAAALAGCAGKPLDQSSRCLTTREVRKHAAELHGKEIEVCGYLKYRAENNNLFESPSQARRYERLKLFEPKGCLSVGMAGGAEPPLGAYNDKWVRLKGKAAADLCPRDGTICLASCSTEGIYVRSVEPLP